MVLCEFCQRECKSLKSHISHKSLCPKNPNRKSPSYGKAGKPAWNKGLVGDPRCSQKGRVGKPHDDKTKKLLSSIAKTRNFGGYNPGSGRSKKFYVKDSFGVDVCLQSSYELICSKILDELSIKWIRPKALKYNNSLYFADFYLPEFDLYLDPKNDYLIKIDDEKIKTVSIQNDVRILMLSKHQLTKAELAQLVRAIA